MITPSEKWQKIISAARDFGMQLMKFAEIFPTEYPDTWELTRREKLRQWWRIFTLKGN